MYTKKKHRSNLFRLIDLDRASVLKNARLQGVELRRTDTPNSGGEVFNLYYSLIKSGKGKKFNPLLIPSGLAAYRLTKIKPGEHFNARLAFLLNKHHHMHQSQVILQNNLDLLRKILSELKYIRARWKSVYITYHEAGPKHHYCSTDTIINRLKTEYDKLYTSEREEFKGILEKLPTWLVEWSDQHTDKQKRMASKRLFAQEAVPYINELAISRNNQYKLLGLFFSLLDLSMDEKKFRDQYKKKHPWDHYTTPEYIAYLRDEGRNIWKNTRLCFRE